MFKASELGYKRSDNRKKKTKEKKAVRLTLEKNRTRNRVLGGSKMSSYFLQAPEFELLIKHTRVAYKYL